MSQDAQNPRGLVAAQFLILQGMLPYNVLPVYLGGLVNHGGFVDTDLAAMANAITGGMALATLLLAPTMRFVNRRAVCMAAILVAAVVNLLTLRTADVTILLVVRGLDGAAMGVLMSIGFAYLARNPHPERQFSINYVLQVVMQTGAQMGLPLLLAAGGMNSFYIVLTCLLPLGFWAAWTLPAHIGQPALPANAIATSTRRTQRLAAHGLAALCIFYVYVTPIYAFSERIGADIGLDPGRLGFGIGLTTLAGVLGSAAALWLSDRYGRRLPLLLGFPVAALTCILLYRPTSESTYWLALALFSITWSYYLPYLLGLIAVVDPVGRFVVVAQGLPLLAGIAGVWIAANLGTARIIDQVPWIAAVGLLLALAVGLHTARRLASE
jgi:predicted MFS family arabinose efflux permease